MNDLLNDYETKHYEWTLDYAITQAEQMGFTVIHSTETLILLDIDNGASQDRFSEVFHKIKSKFNLQFLEEWKSQHGNTHILVSCNPLPFPCRVAIAVCLGSDPVREALAIAMFQDGLEEPSVLFQPEGAKITI